MMKLSPDVDYSCRGLNIAVNQNRGVSP